LHRADFASQSCADHHDPNRQERQRPDKIVMKQPSQITAGNAGLAYNLCGSTHLRSSAATNIRGTSIAKSVISSQTRPTPETHESDHR